MSAVDFAGFLLFRHNLALIYHDNDSTVKITRTGILDSLREKIDLTGKL